MILGKISATGDIINLVEDIRNICTNFKEVSIICRARESNREVDRVVKSVHKHLM